MRLQPVFKKSTKRPGLPLISGLAWVFVAGCSGGAPDPEPARLVIAASDDINLYENAARPVLVRVFQLSSDETFRSANIRTLSADADLVLGEELVGVPTDIFLQPGATETKDIEILPDARFLAVAGLFRDAEGLDWRTISPADKKLFPRSKGMMTLSVSVVGNRVTLDQKQKQKKK